MSTDLAVVDPAVVSLAESLEEAKAWLAETDDPLEINALRLAAEAFSQIKRRNEARDEAIAASEIQTRAERRLGELRNRLPVGTTRGSRIPQSTLDKARVLSEQGSSIMHIGKTLGVTRNTLTRARSRGWKVAPGIDSPRREFDNNLGISETTGGHWSSLAKVSHTTFEQCIEDAKQADRMPTTSYMRSWNVSLGEQVERGIYRLKDGRYKIRWYDYRNKHPRSFTLKEGADLEDARRELLKRRGVIAETVRKLSGLEQAAEQLRSVLITIDDKSADLPPEARKAAEQAWHDGKRAETNLLLALRILDAPGGQWAAA